MGMRKGFSMMRRLILSCLAALAASCAHAEPPVEEIPDKPPTSAEILAASEASDWRRIPAEQLLVIELKGDGQARNQVVIALSEQLAQTHVAQVKKLARDGYYDGLSFYRVIEGFVAQGGDPFGDQATDAPVLEGEFVGRIEDATSRIVPHHNGQLPSIGWQDSLPVGLDIFQMEPSYWYLHCAGTFAFGRETEPDTAKTEFYIMLQPHRYLDRNMSVLGRVVEGMEHIQALRRVSPPTSKADDLGETIIRMSIMADWPEEEQFGIEVLDSNRAAFNAYTNARANRSEDFFVFRPGYIDICELPVPVRRTSD